MYKVALLTEKKYVNPTKRDWYIDQVLKEDELIQKALESKNCSVIKVDWADPKFDWTSVDAAVFRATWDYFNRMNEFIPWLEDIKDKTVLINPYELIQWNFDKHYLIDLKKKKIPIVDSRIIEKGSLLNLSQLHEVTGWRKTVLKPCISGAGRHTYLLDPNNYDEYETIFAELLEEESMMLQPFQEHIIARGEVSHIVIGGQYTHSVLKKAKKGDFRVQDDFGGTVHPYTASKEEIEFTKKVYKACDPSPIYARVDVVWDNNNQLALSELELIEPELWFREHPEAADLLADFVLTQLDK